VLFDRGHVDKVDVHSLGTTPVMTEIALEAVGEVPPGENVRLYPPNDRHAVATRESTGEFDGRWFQRCAESQGMYLCHAGTVT
jgi:hypothetical protein